MKAIKKTFKQVKEKPFYLAIPVFIDLLAMLLFGYTLVDIRMRALNVVANLQGILNKSANMTMQAINQSNVVDIFSQQTELVSAEGALLKLLFVLFVAFWVIWLIFQGSSWRYSAAITEKKPKYFKFMSKFIYINLIWLTAITLLNLFILGHQFNMQVELHSTTMDILTFVAIVLNFIVAYFMFISYTLIPSNKFRTIFKKTFLIGVNKAPAVLLSYLIIGAGFLVVDLLLRLAGLVAPWFVFIVGIFTLLPYITIAKVFLINSIKEIKKN